MMFPDSWFDVEEHVKVQWHMELIARVKKESEENTLKVREDFKRSIHQSIISKRTNQEAANGASDLH